MQMQASRDPTRRFGDRVDNYIRYRPGYPAALIGSLQARGWLPPQSVVADVGAGTGISSALFLDAGCRVLAVEPNVAMREAAVRALGHHSGFHAVDGRAEATSLDTDSIDLVSVAQAFHWFDTDAVRVEWRRILRPGGVAAVYWNSRLEHGSPFLEGYELLLREFGTDYTTVAERHQDDAAMLRWFGTGLLERAEFANAQALDFDALRGRLSSSSYAPQPGQPRHAEMISALRALFEATARDGVVEFSYRTRLFVGTP